MRIYTIKLMGGGVVLGSEEDVKKVVLATQKGVKLVRVRNALINPSSVSSITRSWEAREEDLERDDTSIGMLAESELKQIV